MADRWRTNSDHVKNRKRAENSDGDEEQSAEAAGLAAAAGLSANSELQARVARAMDTFEQRVHVEMPVEDTGSTSVGGGSTGAQQGSSAEASQAQDAAGATAERPRVEIITGAYQAAEEEVDDGHVEAARDYLKATGRWEDVDNLNHAELRAALNNEGQRALLGIEHDVPQSDAQLETYAGVVAEEIDANQEQAARAYLVASGHFTEDEVAAMGSEDLQAAMNVLSRIAAQGEWTEVSTRVTADGQTTITQNGTSLSLENTGTGTSGGGSSDNSGSDSSSGGNTNSSSNSSDGDESGQDDDDDDDDDKDDTSNQQQTQEEATGEQEGNDSNEGEGQEKSDSTPTPDSAPAATPEEIAAFMESPLGREAMQQMERAVAMGAGGGLVDREREPDRTAWMESEASAGERANAERAVEMAIGGGHTDPAEEEPARGVSPINELEVTGGGYTDPVDDPAGPPPEDNPLFPIGVSPVSPQVGALEEMLENGLDTARLANLATALDTSQLSEDIEELG